MFLAQQFLMLRRKQGSPLLRPRTNGLNYAALHLKSPPSLTPHFVIGGLIDGLDLLHIRWGEGEEESVITLQTTAKPQPASFFSIPLQTLREFIRFSHSFFPSFEVRPGLSRLSLASPEGENYKIAPPRASSPSPSPSPMDEGGEEEKETKGVWLSQPLSCHEEEAEEKAQFSADARSVRAI